MKIWDITMQLSDRTAEWPGDIPFSYQTTATIEQTGSVNVGEIHMSTHNGTHIDAPFHYDNKGIKVHELPLDIYIGKTAVVDVTGEKRITDRHLTAAAGKGVTAIFLKTGGWPDRSKFPSDYPVYDDSIAAWMEENKVLLLGVETPSVDPETSKDLPMHQAMNKHKRFILEGIVLDEVPAGIYEYAALPLNIAGSDGSPVRAVLFEK
ncbi:cyclase family protein [Planococcus lenghuensis]|uniref:Kynurenine formamidase n=1 Tax=Planococcus lenghuensis TaxID=2213202 RepID=A0A1Q2KWD9_9BACL|nr:cyclase family protein [Planococcus lenghuensis]AQQ52535.1 arylformamidase [Planococcus lenghuensis]